MSRIILAWYSYIFAGVFVYKLDMKKFLLLFFLILSFEEFCFAQDYHSRWLFTTELSPSFPSSRDRVVSNADNYSSLEWRNRIGVRTFGNLFIGVQASVRNYSETLTLSTDIQSHIGSSTIESRLENTMLGFGPFFNYYLELSPKFYLLGSGFIGLEKGVGAFKYTLISNTCPSCEGIAGTFPRRLGESSFKDVLLTYSGDLGMGYLINEAVGIQFMVNLLRYERSSYLTREYNGEPFDNPGFRMFYSESVRSWSSISDRMIFHVGIFMALNFE